MCVESELLYNALMKLYATQPSYESGVTGYRVSMTPRKDLMSSDVLVPPSLPSSVLIKGRTSYTLDPAICDNVMYSYTVEAVNVCNRGSQPVTVSQKCCKCQDSEQLCCSLL